MLLGACAGLFAAPGAALAQDEVPFVVTPDAVTLAMLEIAGTGASDHVVDLGSGDGRIVILAATRFGASGLGVDLVPELVERSRASAARAGVASRAAFRVQDLFETDLSRATVVTMYLLPEVNLQLRPRLLALQPGTRIVSHDWPMGDWQPDRTLTLDVPDKPVGRERLSRVHLWVVPARVAGVWCGSGGERLVVTQRFQRYSVEHVRPGQPAPRVHDGRVDGTRLVPDPGSDAAGLRLEHDVLVTDPAARGPAARWTRSPAGRACPR